MKGKQLINLSLDGSSGWSCPPSTTPSCPGSVHSVTTRVTSRVTSARSNITSLLGRSQLSSTASYNPSSAGTSRLTSAISRASSARKKQFRKTEKCPTPPVSSFEEMSAEITSVMDTPGLTVWCLEDRSLCRVSSMCHGFFHQGNCYLVMRVDDENYKFLHFWQGSRSVNADREILWSRAEDVDRLVSGAVSLTCEYEGKETPLFLRHFPDGMIICEGKSKQYLGRASKYHKRLYVVKGRKYPVATCVECSPSAVSPDSCLILDGFPRIYLKMGDNVDAVSRVKAINLAKKIRIWQRNGKGHIIVIDTDEKALSESFLRKLSNYETSRGCLESARSAHTAGSLEDTDNQPSLGALYRVTGDRVMYDMPLAATQPLQQKYLNPTDCFILDSGPSLPLYIWVGLKASEDALHCALQRAKTFTQHKGYPATVPLCRLTDGEEPLCFKAMFANWRDRTTRERQLIRSYSAANIGRVLYSRSDRRTVPKLAELWSDDHFLIGDGNTEMWRVDQDVLIPLKEGQNGMFHSNECYILLHREWNHSEKLNIIYYWLGKKADDVQQSHAMDLAMKMDATLSHQTVIIQVLDGKEPKHFLAVMKGSMIVHDPEARHGSSLESDDVNNNMIGTHDDSVCMYSIRELAPNKMRVTQVSPVSSSLNSSAAYVIWSKDSACLWFGKNAKAQEREYAKSILSYFCPYRAFDYDIYTEGKETAKFWIQVHYNCSFPKEFPKPKLERRLPQMIFCEQREEQWIFSDMPEFSQEDLCELHLFILDTHDQVILWCGNSVTQNDSGMFANILKTYIAQDTSGRQSEDLQIWFINQEYEPSSFIKYFKEWDKHGYGGSIAYAAARKCVRQENAMIDPDCQMVDLTYMPAIKVSYKQLVKEEDLPESVDLQHKEYHLTDREFTKVMNMTRAQFYRMPLWKQIQILKSARLLKLDKGSFRSTQPTIMIDHFLYNSY